MVLNTISQPKPINCMMALNTMLIRRGWSDNDSHLLLWFQEELHQAIVKKRDLRDKKMTAAQDTQLVRHHSIVGDTRYENDRVTIYLSLTCRDESFRLICGFHLFSTKNLVYNCVEHEPGSWKMKVFWHCIGGEVSIFHQHFHLWTWYVWYNRWTCSLI